MLISPPFLPVRRTGQSDSEWVAMAMRQPNGRAVLSSAFEGSFPLSSALMWHNGVHIQAPSEPDGVTWPAVRAIASGTIVHVGVPRKANDSMVDMQNYNPFGKHPAWTDNGMIVVVHEAEIGASNDAANAPTAFRFYSAYMHLGSIATNAATRKPWALGDTVARKDELGRPGQIYGDAGQIHLEICCNTADAAIVLNRPPGWQENRPAAPPTSDGRTDAVFGSMWFYLPIGTPTRATRPLHHHRIVSGGASAATDRFIPDTLRHAQWVELHYEQGDATIRSVDIDGQPIGSSLRASNAEHDLYDEAISRHERYRHHSPPATGRLDSSPSGWYELLRFGRNLGFGAVMDPLPTNAAHWREIPTAAGTIWADLNALGTFKFSDADFLPVAGWNCYDDDANPHSQLCESAHLKRLLRRPDQRQRMAALSERTAETDITDRQSMAERLDEQALQSTLRRAVCDFPTEWDRGTIEKRYKWVRNPAEKLLLDNPVNWANLTAHLRAISFDDLPAGYKEATWRFHPAEFIATFRQCGWLSRKEMREIYREEPYQSVGKPHDQYIHLYQNPLNFVARKYLLNTPLRMGHFFGQIAQESFYLMLSREASIGISTAIRKNHISVQPETTGYLQFSTENKLETSYLRRYEGLKVLANTETGDGIKFRGRGLKQLTGRFNYAEYWMFRGWLDPSTFDRQWFKNGKPGPEINDPQKIGDSPINAADTAGYYCASHRLSKISDKGMTEAISNSVTHLINPGESPPASLRWKETSTTYKFLGDE